MPKTTNTTPPSSSITPEEQRKKWAEEAELQFKEEKVAEEKREIQKETFRILRERLETPEDRNKRLSKEAKDRIKKSKEDLDNSKYEKDYTKQTWEDIRGIKSELGYGLDKKIKGIGDAIGNGLSMIAPEIAPLVAGVKSTFGFFKNLKEQKSHREDLKADLEIKQQMLQESKFASEYAQKTFGITDSLYKFFTHGEKGAGKFTPRKESYEPTDERDYDNSPITSKPNVGSTSERTFAESIIPAGNGNTSEIGSDVMPLYNEQVKTNEKLDKIYNFLVGEEKTRTFERREDKIAGIENAEEAANAAFFAKRGTSEKSGKSGSEKGIVGNLIKSIFENPLDIAELGMEYLIGKKFLPGGIKGLLGKGAEVATKGTAEVAEVATKGTAEVAEVATKGTEKVAVEGAEKVAEKGAVKLGEKELLKGGAKTLGKTLLKKIPLIGALAGIGFGIGRLMDGDPLGAGLEVASGLVSSLPVVGTAASLAIDGGLIARDMGALNGKDSQSPTSEPPKTKPGGNWFGNIAKSVAGMGFLGPAGVLLSGLFGGDDDEAKKKKMADIPEKLDEIKSILWSIYGVLNSKGGNRPTPEAPTASPAGGGPELTKSAPAPPASSNTPQSGSSAPAPQSGSSAPAPQSGSSAPAPQSGSSAPTSEKATQPNVSGSGKAAAEQYLGTPISNADYDKLVRATYAESSNKDPKETAMIMGSILNRARTDKGGITGVLEAKNQFQSVTGTKNNPGPSNQYITGPNEKNRAAIEASASMLAGVPTTQKNFTAASSKAYGAGTNLAYRDQLDGSIIGGTKFGSNFIEGQPSLGQSIAKKDKPLLNVLKGPEAIASERMPIDTSAVKFTPRTGSEDHFKGMDANAQRDFAAMAAEYKAATGKDLTVNSAYRSSEEQKNLNSGSLPKATPGKSKHQAGTALDLPAGQVSALASSGLLDKYGFKGLPGDPVHINYTKPTSSGPNAQNIAEATSTKAPSDTKYPFLTGYTPTNPNDITSAPAGSPYAKKPAEATSTKAPSDTKYPFLTGYTPTNPNDITSAPAGSPYAKKPAEKANNGIEWTWDPFGKSSEQIKNEKDYGTPIAPEGYSSVQDQAKILSQFEPKQATAIPKPVETGDDISMKTRNIGYGNYANNSNEKVPVINQTNIVSGGSGGNPNAQQRSAPGNGAKNPNTSDGLLAAASTGSLFEYLKMTFS